MTVNILRHALGRADKLTLANNPSVMRFCLLG